jgi:hypothetical protein
MRRILADVEFDNKVPHVLGAVYLWSLLFFDKVIEICGRDPLYRVMQSIAGETTH